MVDGKGLTSADRLDVADILRRTGKGNNSGVNKVDNPARYIDNIYDFYELS